MHVLQFLNNNNEVTVCVIENGLAYPLDTNENFYNLIMRSLRLKINLSSLIKNLKTRVPITYEELIENKKIILPIHHDDSSHMIVTGVGLTHLNSTILRNNMYERSNSLSDAQKIYQDSLLYGKPPIKKIGMRPEWFYKGNGHILKSTSDYISIPSDAICCGEEAELIAIYVISPYGEPYRIGFALGNEFSDHGLEKVNSYYMAQSKLFECSIGPEIYIGNIPENLSGQININRSYENIWSKNFNTGYQNMTYSLQNIEHHLFKNKLFKNPGDIHILYLGADQVSFADNIKLIENDVISIQSSFFHFPLENRIKCESLTDIFSAEVI